MMHNTISCLLQRTTYPHY